MSFHWAWPYWPIESKTNDFWTSVTEPRPKRRTVENFGQCEQCQGTGGIKWQDTVNTARTGKVNCNRCSGTGVVVTSRVTEEF